ncbi:MAG: endolytic transglycosylase MltG [Nitrospiraceae bacterium]
MKVPSRWIPWIGAVCVTFLAACIGLQWMFRPLSASPQPQPIHLVVIPDGATFRQVAMMLEHEHLIRSRWPFELLGRLTWSDRRIPAGEYALHAGMSGREILSDIIHGRILLHSVTIPEGSTAAEIAKLLGQKGLSDPGEFLRLVHDRDFMRTLDLNVPSLEGYLFPNTYQFARPAQPKDIIKTLTTELWQAFTPELRARAQEMNMSVNQVLTLASVIEKETSVEAERGLVSAVFHNRLRRNILLQSDPTVIYALNGFDGNLKKRDLSVASPYNTYRVKGLPPGPIASPGASSIRAALYPATGPYLYFVSRNNGTHEFSSTLAAHNRAVERYQRRPPRRNS